MENSTNKKFVLAPFFPPSGQNFVRSGRKRRTKMSVWFFFQQQKMIKVITADVERVVEFLGRFRDGFVCLFGENDRWRGDGVEK